MKYSNFFISPIYSYREAIPFPWYPHFLSKWLCSNRFFIVFWQFFYTDWSKINHKNWVENISENRFLQIETPIFEFSKNLTSKIKASLYKYVVFKIFTYLHLFLQWKLSGLPKISVACENSDVNNEIQCHNLPFANALEKIIPGS